MTNIAFLAAILLFQISYAQPGNGNQPPQPPQAPQQQSPPATMDLRLVAAVMFTVGVFLVFPAIVLTMRYWFGLERSANHYITDEEVPLMWFKWAVIIAVSGFVVFGLPFLLPLYIGVYILAGLGGLVLVYLFLSHVVADPAARETRPRTQLTVEERNRLVRNRIEELRRRQGPGQDQRGSARRRAPEFKGVPPEVIDTFPFRIWAPQPIFNAISAFSQASVADNGIIVVPSSKIESHRPAQLQLEEEGNLPGSIASPTAANKVPAEDDPCATNLNSPAFKQRPGSRILSVMNRPVKSRLFSMSFSKTKIAPVEEGPSCPICLEEFQAGEEVSTMPCHGRHEFHRTCIGDWMKAHRNCPICRGDLWDGVSKAAANAHRPQEETTAEAVREPAGLQGPQEEEERSS